MPYFDFGTLQNPFEKIPAGTMQRVNYANPGTGDSGPPGPEYLPTQEDAWGLSAEYMEANPQGFSILSNPNNFQVLGQNEDGSYNVKLKTADKEGSIFNLHQDENGRWQETPVSKEYWDTNVSWDKRFGFMIPLVAGAAWAGAVAAAGAFGVAGPSGSVLGDLAAGGAAVKAPAAGSAAGSAAGGSSLYDLSAGNSLLGPGTKATVGLAVPESMSSTALLSPSLTAPGSTLAATGGFTVADLVQGGVNTFADPFSLSSIPPTQSGSFGIPPGGFPGAGITNYLDPTTLSTTPNTFPPGTQMPGGNPLNTPGGGQGLTPTSEIPAPPGSPGSNLPPTPPGATGPTGPPATPPGGTGGTGASAISLLDWLMRMYDAYNKGNKQEEYADEMFRWANKIFGQSANFENMLMDTYTNPTGWLEGPEGAALNRIVQNQNLRTDSRAGNLSNDTNRSVVLQDQMMKGLGNYRTGLGQSAALGRNASAVALDAVGKAIKSDYNASQWYTPLTYGAGQSGTPSVGGTISSLWNDVKNLGGAANEAWKWFTGLTGSP